MIIFDTLVLDWKMLLQCYYHTCIDYWQQVLHPRVLPNHSTNASNDLNFMAFSALLGQMLLQSDIGKCSHIDCHLKTGFSETNDKLSCY